MLASEIIGGYTCYFDCQEDAEALLIQAAWTLVLVLGGIFFWRTNQRKLIIQGG